MRAAGRVARFWGWYMVGARSCTPRSYLSVVIDVTPVQGRAMLAQPTDASTTVSVARPINNVPQRQQTRIQCYALVGIVEKGSRRSKDGRTLRRQARDNEGMQMLCAVFWSRFNPKVKIDIKDYYRFTILIIILKLKSLLPPIKSSLTSIDRKKTQHNQDWQILKYQFQIWNSLQIRSRESYVRSQKYMFWKYISIFR